MKDQLRLLQQLQRIDAQIQEERKAIDALPEKLAPAKKDLAKLEGLLQQEKDQLKETETWRAEQEELIQREEEAVKHAKAKVQQAKNARDFAASNREVDNKRRNISEREEEVLKVIEVIETTRANIEAHEKDVAELRKHVETEEASHAAKIAEIEKGLTGLVDQRDKLAAGVPPGLLRRYETVQKRRGMAVAPVTNGVCGGCHMALPPQLNNILARFESVETCPTCQRLLYRIELFEGEEESAD